MTVISRLLAAVVGGYALASLCAALLAFALPLVFALTLADGVVIGTMLGFAVHAGWFVFAFSPAPAGRIWLWLTAALCVVSLLLWIVGGNALFPPAS